ncbi:MAG: host attachment protein [Planctomycetaceae bacterium]
MTRRYHTPTVPVTWIVVADRSRARILSAMSGDCADLCEVEDLVNPVGALKASEVAADGQGYHAGRPGYLEACEPRTDHEHKTAEPFAQQIVSRLEAGRNSQQFGHLILIAAPLFLGILRQKLSQPLARMVELEVDKDYSKHSVREVTALLTKQ